jgi:hypothetical protein
MTYRIKGLDRAAFERFFAMDDVELAGNRGKRVVATADRGYPCRISLKDARKGETLLLVHHTSHAVDTPYRSAYAIFVREAADGPAEFIDRVPPVFEGRPLALRGFGADGELKAARLAMPGEADETIRALLADEPQVAYIDAHNAAHGCFSARIERYKEAV